MHETMSLKFPYFLNNYHKYLKYLKVLKQIFSFFESNTQHRIHKN
jgi:hypothetical protein